ncbi:hypothetical protein C0993_000910 [Termitomyces sp. T159_Od127]|nr:hypothetical protein C0993_000910 [Termitomyces sp. T159_Od127]
MPKKSRQSQQAKAQNTQGKCGFGSGLLDDGSVTKLQDPDFVPSESIDGQSDSDWEDKGYQGAYTLHVAVSKPPTAAEDEGEEATDKVDFENAIILEPSNDVEPPVKHPHLIKALPTYSGTSRATVFKKKKELFQASKGCKTINSYFVKQVSESKNSHVPEVHKLSQRAAEITEAQRVMDSEVEMQSEMAASSREDNTMNIPTVEHECEEHEHEPEEHITDEIPENILDEISIEELLDVTVDDELNELEPNSRMRPGIKALVEKLLKDA